MSKEDLTSLADLGLSFLQAKTYIALLSLGSCKASQLTLRTGLVRPETYRILRELSVKGLVQRSAGSPYLYSPTPPSEALSILFNRVGERFAALKKGKNALARSLASYVSHGEGLRDERFDLITGGGNALRTVLDMIRRAESEYVSISSKDGLIRLGGRGILGEEYEAAIIAAKRRHVRIRVISEIDKSTLPAAEHVSRFAELRKLKDVLFYIDMVDKREMCIGPGITPEDAGEQNAREADLWTNNAKFIRGMCAMFERLWKAAPPYLSSIKELS